MWATPTFALDTPLTPQDAIPHEAALDRLVRAKVVSDDQLMDYELSQALRGVAVAVKAASPHYPCPFASSGGAAAGAEGKERGVRVFGREAVLFRMCTAAVVNPSALPTLVYVSARLLCDAAGGYGEGNARPCCTPEWIHVLLAAVGGDSDSAFSEEGRGLVTSDAFQAHVAVDRRFQLGYLRLVAGTVRSVATGGAAVGGKKLFTDFLALTQAILAQVFPFAAMLAEGKADRVASASAPPPPCEPAAFHAPSLLTAEANGFLLQCTYWLCMDALGVHLEKEGTKTPTNRVLDRAAPQVLWTHVPRLRGAFRRAFVWLEQEMRWQLRQLQQLREREFRKAMADKKKATAGSSGAVVVGPNAAERSSDVIDLPPPPPPPPRVHDNSAHVALSLVRATRGHVEAILTDVLREQEQLDFARRSAVQRYGESAKDVHNVREAMWGETLRLCVLLQSLTGAWVSVQGGLGLSATTNGFVLRSDRDVLMSLASCVARLPSASDSGGKRESRSAVAAATDALLCAAVTLAAAAPLSEMQRELWSIEGGTVTAEIHRVLTQRGLHFGDKRVLQLSALLMNSIMNTAVSAYGGGGSGGVSASMALASETSEQLLNMLEEGRDAASHVAVELLMSAVAQRPHVLVPALFRLLKSNGASARENALAVLAGLPRALHTAGMGADAEAETAADEEGGTGSHERVAVEEGKLREVLRLLAEQLLLHLQDEELVTRMQSASLFAKVWPEDVVYPLLIRCLQRDPRGGGGGAKQAAAKAALTSVVVAHGDTASIALLLLQAAFQLLPATAPESQPLNALTEKQDTAVSSLLRATPAHPGDVLTKALLYDPTPIQENEGETSEGNGSSTGGSPVKAERLHSLLLSLCTTWVNAVCERSGGLTAAQHVEPLLRFLKAVEQPQARQFYLRHITALLSLLTARTPHTEVAGTTATAATATTTAAAAMAGSPLPVEPSPSQRVVVEAMHNVFFRHPSTPSSRPWLESVVAAAAAEEKERGAKAHEDGLYAVLLPLLCLRSCSRDCFVELSLEEEEEEEEEAAAAAESAGAAEACPSAAAGVFSSVWEALLREPYQRFFYAHRDMQRVLLEVACKAPPHLFFTAIGVDRQRWEREGVGSPEALFVARVSVFGVCSYLATLPWVKGAGCCRHLRECTGIVQRLRSVLTLAEDGAAGSSPEQAMLRHGVLDGVALASLCSLYTADHVAFQVLQDTFLGFRFDREEPEERWMASLLPETHEHMLEIARTHPKAPELLLLWFTHFQQPLIELANAACHREETPCPTAVQCGNVIFRAIMLASKMETSLAGGATASSPPACLPSVGIRAATGSGPGSAVGATDAISFFARHASAVNCDALVSFGVGCARSRFGVPLQHVGVRILAALLGAALDRLLIMDPSPLDTVVGVLRNVAWIHEDAATRQLAEQVLQAMPGIAPTD